MTKLSAGGCRRLSGRENRRRRRRPRAFPRTPDEIGDYVLHYMDVFDRLRLAAFDLAGFSLGGWMAAEFAIRQPRRIDRLVLLAPAGLVVEHAPAPDLFQIQPQELPS